MKGTYKIRYYCSEECETVEETWEGSKMPDVRSYFRMIDTEVTDPSGQRWVPNCSEPQATHWVKAPPRINMWTGKEY